MKLRSIVAGAIALVLSATAAMGQVTPGSGSTGQFGEVIITPIANTNNQGLFVSQTTPNTGTVAGPIGLNVITVTDQAQTVTGSGLDSFGQINNQTDALRINHRVTGGATNHFGISVASNITGSNGGTAPIVAGTYLNTPVTASTSWGMIAYANVGASGSMDASSSLIGIESEMLAATGSSITKRIAFSANSQGPVVGSSIDAAFVVSVFPQAITGYTTAAPFSDGIFFSNNLYAAATFPVATTGNIMRGDTGTVANFANFSGLTVTGNIFNFGSPFTVSGAGAIKASGSSSQIVVNQGTFTGNGISGTPAGSFTGPDGASGGLQIGSFGTGVNSAVILYAARGTGVSPTASQANDIIGFFASAARTGAGTIGTSNGLALISSEAQSPTTEGMYGQMLVTNTGTTTRVAAWTTHASGGLAIGGQGIASPANDPGAGGIFATGIIKSNGPTSGIGYATGAGGAVVQATSRTTGVTLNKVTGAITLVSAAGSATPSTFTLTNSAIAANDVVKVTQQSGTDKYEIFVSNTAAGSCAITFFTTGGTTTEQPVFNFVVIKGVNSYLMRRDLDPATNDSTPAFIMEKAA